MDIDFYRHIRKTTKPFIIAEIGANHNGDMRLAKKLIRAAKACGADAVKFQSWSKESLFAKSFYKENSEFVEEHFGTLEQAMEWLSLDKSKHIYLKKYCKKVGIIFSSTPFSRQEIDLLDHLKVPFFKIASMDINNIPLLEHVAAKKKPIILSTGMASIVEIKTALDVIYRRRNKKVILLHCVALYPPKDENINLRNITMFQEIFNIPVGFSDHTLGTSLALAAISLGAKVIEKHFTIDKTMPGWDHAISADPKELKNIVIEGRRVQKALGKYKRVVLEDEINQRKIFRRSIIAKVDLTKHEIISIDNIDCKRPGYGISPAKLQQVIGKRLRRDISAGELISWRSLK